MNQIKQVYGIYLENVYKEISKYLLIKEKLYDKT